MCGIFGYVGPQNAVQMTIEGLKRLEYRGYDSAGIGGLRNGKIEYCKVLGKVGALERAAETQGLELELAIGQTRWATHGKPSQINAHPHFDKDHSVAVVHNGIIENHETLRKMLVDEGDKFASQTDTEVIAHLIAHFYDGDVLRAVQETLPLLQGAYAFAVVHKDMPGQIIAVASHAPLALGIGNGENFLSSDPNVLPEGVREVMHLENGDVAVIRADEITTFDSSRQRVIKTRELIASQVSGAVKGEYAHFTLKEIFEQPTTLQNVMFSRTIPEYGTALLEGLNFDISELMGVQRILILACGTSWHAGYLGGYMLEDQARIPTQVEISSEYRYKNPIVQPGTLVIAISQSGETADTLAAIRELKAKGSKVLAICNVHGSSIAREADGCLFLRAGPEIGVCSTKAFTSQVMLLTLFTLLMARMRNMDRQDGQTWIQAMEQIPLQVQQVLSQAPAIQAIAEKYSHYDNFFFIGRRYMYPTALEGALKLKEISYVNANGYPAGEMKHGPIALINPQCPTVALCANRATWQKMLSNLEEVRARSGPILAIATEGTEGLVGLADDIIWHPATTDELSAILSTIVTQLLAYYIAVRRGCEIDQPRNLAKSVTVE